MVKIIWNPTQRRFPPERTGPVIGPTDQGPEIKGPADSRDRFPRTEIKGPGIGEKRFPPERTGPVIGPTDQGPEIKGPWVPLKKRY